MVKLTCLSVLLVLAVSSPPTRAQEKIRIANEGTLGDAWGLPPASKQDFLQYPTQYADHPADACLAIGYLINPDGQVSDFGLLKSWSSKEPRRERDRYWGALTEVASATLSERRYMAKTGVAAPRPVYTVATFVFASPNTNESSKRCAIPDLSQRISDLKRNPRSRNRMSSNAVFDRLELDPFRDSRRREGTAQLHVPPPPPPPTAPKT